LELIFFIFPALVKNNNTIDDYKKIFIYIYKEIDDYKISRDARKKQSYFYIADTYGEVDFDSFNERLKLTEPKQNEIFYDLGLGVGKPSLVVYLNFNFSKIIGIEQLKDLYQSSKTALENLQKNYLSICQKKTNCKIDFIHGDFNNYDFTDGDIIFINSYFYFYYQLSSGLFREKIKKLKKGSRVITTAMPIISNEFEIEKKDRLSFSRKTKKYIYIEKFKII